MDKNILKKLKIKKEIFSKVDFEPIIVLTIFTFISVVFFLTMLESAYCTSLIVFATIVTGYFVSFFITRFPMKGKLIKFFEILISVYTIGIFYYFSYHIPKINLYYWVSAIFFSGFFYFISIIFQIILIKHEALKNIYVDSISVITKSKNNKEERQMEENFLEQMNITKEDIARINFKSTAILMVVGCIIIGFCLKIIKEIHNIEVAILCTIITGCFISWIIVKFPMKNKFMKFLQILIMFFIIGMFYYFSFLMPKTLQYYWLMVMFFSAFIYYILIGIQLTLVKFERLKPISTIIKEFFQKLKKNVKH